MEIRRRHEMRRMARNYLDEAENRRAKNRIAETSFNEAENRIGETSFNEAENRINETEVRTDGERASVDNSRRVNYAKGSYVDNMMDNKMLDTASRDGKAESPVSVEGEGEGVGEEEWDDDDKKWNEAKERESQMMKERERESKKLGPKPKIAKRPSKDRLRELKGAKPKIAKSPEKEKFKLPTSPLAIESKPDPDSRASSALSLTALSLAESEEDKRAEAEGDTRAKEDEKESPTLADTLRGIESFSGRRSAMRPWSDTSSKSGSKPIPVSKISESKASHRPASGMNIEESEVTHRTTGSLESSDSDVANYPPPTPIGSQIEVTHPSGLNIEEREVTHPSGLNIEEREVTHQSGSIQSGPIIEGNEVTNRVRSWLNNIGDTDESMNAVRIRAKKYTDWLRRNGLAFGGITVTIIGVVIGIVLSVKSKAKEMSNGIRAIANGMRTMADDMKKMADADNAYRNMSAPVFKFFSHIINVLSMITKMLSSVFHFISVNINEYVLVLSATMLYYIYG